MIIHKTAYETLTGKILYSLSGVEGFIHFPETEGISYADGTGDSKTQEVVDGKIVDKPNDILQQQEIDAAWVYLKAERTRRLYATDWTQVPDAPVDSLVWSEYRQALRDLPDNTADPLNPVWPTPPV